MSDLYNSLSHTHTGKKALLDVLVKAAPTLSVVELRKGPVPFSSAMGILKSMDERMIKQETMVNFFVRLDERLALPFRLHEQEDIVTYRHRIEEARRNCQQKLIKLNEILGKVQIDEMDQDSKSGRDE